MSARVEGGTVLVMVTAHATLSAGSTHLSRSAREGPALGTGVTTSATVSTAAPRLKPVARGQPRVGVAGAFVGRVRRPRSSAALAG